MITSKLKEVLSRLPAYQSLIEKISKRGYNLLTAPESLFEDFCGEILSIVDQKLINQPALQSEVRDKSEGRDRLSAKTLKRLFDPEDRDIKNPQEPRREKSLNAILIYAEIPKEEWKYYKEIDSSNELISRSTLIGYWYIYRYDRTLLKRTVMQIHFRTDGTLQATYKSLHNTLYESGTVSIKGQIITINFINESKTIEICGFIDDSVLNEERIINAIIRSTRESIPYATHCVIVFDTKEEKNIHHEKATVVLHSTSKNKQYINAIRDPNIDPIIVYLNRKHNHINAKPFQPSSMEEIENRNKKHFRYNTSHHFDFLLEQRWFSISHSTTKEFYFNLLEWKFTFEEMERKCYVECFYPGKLKTA